MERSKSEAPSTRTRSLGRRNEEESTAGGDKSTAEETKSKTARKDERGKCLLTKIHQLANFKTEVQECTQ